MVVVMVMVMVMVMAMVMIVVVVVVVTMVTVIPVVPVVMLVARHVFAVVPVITDKVHRATASMIFAAISCPMRLMSRPHVEINRWTAECRIPVNHNGSRVDQRRRFPYAAEINLTKESRLADIHGYSDIRCHYWCGRKKESR